MDEHDHTETANNNSDRISLSLSGMHCASCAAIIERSIKKLPGIKSANVNFSSERATVTFDKTQISAKEIVTAVSGAGYRAAIINQADSEFETKKREREINGLRRLFVFSLIFSLPMLYFMLLDFFPGLPGGNILPPYF